MTVYVDDLFKRKPKNPQAKKHGEVWCHMFTDSENLEELHAIAQKIGLKRRYFQHRQDFYHYDLTPAKRETALQNGAKYIHIKKFLKLKKSNHE